MLTRHIDVNSALKIRYLLEGSLDGFHWFVVEDKRRTFTNLPHDYLRYEDGINARFIRITAFELPYGEKFALSGLRVFGKGGGSKPGSAEKVNARRSGDLDARIEWEKVDQAQGYNVRYGIAPDKLYASYLVYENNFVDIVTLNKGQSPYFVCVDSFNENGITEGEIIEFCEN